MNVDIFLMCYNEASIIEETIRHYRTLLPRCSITILDNMSTDGSVEIAQRNGCRIKRFNTSNHMDATKMGILRNDCWKTSFQKWVIVADMDEWICVNEKDLIEEDRLGTTVLTIKGYNIIGDSKDASLRDINLHQLHHGVYHAPESKSICFKVGPIREMNFTHGCHSCTPHGTVRYSAKEYILKHMDYLGLPYKLDKQNIRFQRSLRNRQRGMSTHYAVSADTIRAEHDTVQQSKKDIYDLVKDYMIVPLS
jgi:glycosyltransferase involved in cell wall biosynthesis